MKFKLFGFPVAIRGSFFLLIGLYAFSSLITLGPVLRAPALWPLLLSPSSWMVAAILSLLVHELGHAAAFRRYGHSPSIELHALGGHTLSSGGLSSKADAVTSAAGPAAGFVIGGLMLSVRRYLLPGLGVDDDSLSFVTSLFAPSSGGLSGRDLVELGLFEAAFSFMDSFIWISFVWGLFNLVPILPLDGGRIVKALLNLKTKGKGETPARFVSLIAGGSLLAVALVLRWYWVAFIIFIFGRENLTWLSEWRGRDAQNRLRLAYDELKFGHPEAAASIAEEILRKKPTGQPLFQATEILAGAYLAEGRVEEAHELLERLPNSVKRSEFMEAFLLFHERGREVATELGLEFYKGDDDVGYKYVWALLSAGEFSDAKDVILSSGDRLNEAAHHDVQRRLHREELFRESVLVGQAGFERFGVPHFAYNAACSLSLARESDEALEWLRKAIEGGFDDLAYVRNDPEFASLKDNSRFRLLTQWPAEVKTGTFL